MKKIKNANRKLVSAIVLLVIVSIISACYAYSPLKNKISTLLCNNPVYAMLNSNEVSNIRQVITKDSTSSRTIMWQSPTDYNDFVIEYGVNTNDEKNLPEEIYTIQPEKSILDVDGKQVFIYNAVLDNLQPNTNYSYRIGRENKRTDWYTLTTESTDNTQFKTLIFPDSQSSDYTDWRNLSMTAWQNNPDADFFINLGDLVDNGYDLSQWDSWFNSVEPMVTKIPVAPIMGNHEAYNMNWKVAMPEPYLNMFNLPGNGSSYKNQYYSYDYGNVHFTVLNTQDNELHEFQPNMMEAQLAWLENDLASTTKKWKVVLMHRDILVYGRDAAPLGDEIRFSEEGRIFMPIFDKYNVDAVFTAHLHTYHRRVLLRNFQPNDNGTLYILSGVAGNVRYPNLWHRNPLDAYVAPQPETDNYIVLDASENQLAFRTYLPDNSLIDSVTLTK